MMTRRISTAAPEPPVMFYKIVALSFVVITVVLLGVVIFMTSKKATIIVVSKEDSVPTNFEARVVSGKSAPGETVSGVVTSTIFEWAKQYSPQGTKLVTGTAQGEVTVYNKSNTAITLIPKTRFITSEGVLFRLTSYTNVPAHGQVTTAVYADKPGREGEIPPSQFTLPGLDLILLSSTATTTLVAGETKALFLDKNSSFTCSLKSFSACVKSSCVNTPI